MFNKKTITLLAAASLVGFSTAAQDVYTQSTTETENVGRYRSVNQPHVGIMGGVTDTNDARDPMTDLGIDIGFQPFVPVGLGLEAYRLRNSTAFDQDNERVDVLAKVLYNFGGTTPVIKNSYVGLALGGLFHDDDTTFASGPVLGVDIPLTNQTMESFFSLGANAKYLFTDGSESEVFAVNGVIKYWY